MVRGVVAGGGKPHPMPASRAPLSQGLAGAGRHLAACAFDLRLGSHVFPSEMRGISPWPELVQPELSRIVAILRFVVHALSMRSI